MLFFVAYGQDAEKIEDTDEDSFQRYPLRSKKPAKSPSNSFPVTSATSSELFSLKPTRKRSASALKVALHPGEIEKDLVLMRVPHMLLPKTSTESNVLAKRVQKVLKTSEVETTILAYELDKEKDSEESLDLLDALLDYEENESTLNEFLKLTSEPPFTLKRLSAPGTKARKQQIAECRKKAAEFSRSQKRFVVLTRVQDLRKLAEEDDDIPAGTKIIGRSDRERVDEAPKNLYAPPPITCPNLPLGSPLRATSPSERLKELFPQPKIFIQFH